MNLLERNLMTKWWGDVEFELNEAKCWRIGRRQIVVQRKEREWLIWNDETKEESFDTLQLETLTDVDSLADVPLQRFLVDKTQNLLSVIPALADRSVIIRPSSVLSLLPGEKTQLYVSSPLWLKFATHGTNLPLTDLPFWLPSDSWFGLSTMLGELCYAKYTDAKVAFVNIEKRSHRAITTINISNEHEEPLTIQRINLATPFLDLYADTDNQFWTDTVCLTHNENNDRPSFEIKRLNTKNSKSAHTLVCSARQIADKFMFMRSIRSLVA
ncbi:MAG: hypothetical protein ACI88A_002031 [Paraglaciecola sp.]|jgi:hypothetical protein